LSRPQGGLQRPHVLLSLVLGPHALVTQREALEPLFSVLQCTIHRPARDLVRGASRLGAWLGRVAECWRDLRQISVICVPPSIIGDGGVFPAPKSCPNMATWRCSRYFTRVRTRHDPSTRIDIAVPHGSSAEYLLLRSGERGCITCATLDRLEPLVKRPAPTVRGRCI